MAVVVPNDPLPAYNFRVWLGNHEFGFSKVSGLSRESEPFTYQEGGVNDRVHVLPGPTKNCGTVRLERGIYKGGSLPFYAVGVKLSASMRIEIWNDDAPSESAKAFMLSGLVIKKWEVGDLDAQTNALLIDRFELSYEFMYT